MILSTWVAPSSAVVRADRLAGPVELAGEGPVQDLGHERALAAARDAGDRGECPEWHGQVEIAEVVFASALDPQLLAVAAASFRRDRHGSIAAQDTPR